MPQGSSPVWLPSGTQALGCDDTGDQQGWLNNNSGLLLVLVTIQCSANDEAVSQAVSFVDWAHLRGRIYPGQAALREDVDVLVSGGPSWPQEETRIWAQGERAYQLVVLNGTEGERREEGVRQARSLAASQPASPSPLRSGLPDWAPQGDGWSAVDHEPFSPFPVTPGCEETAGRRSWIGVGGRTLTVGLVRCGSPESAVTMANAYAAGLRDRGKTRRAPIFGFGTDTTIEIESGQGLTLTSVWAQGSEAVTVSLAGGAEVGRETELLLAQCRSLAAAVALERFSPQSLEAAGNPPPYRLKDARHVVGLSYVSFGLLSMPLLLIASLYACVWGAFRARLRKAKDPGAMGTRSSPGEVSAFSVQKDVDSSRRRRLIRRGICVLAIVAVMAGGDEASRGGSIRSSDTTSARGWWMIGIVCAIGLVSRVFWSRLHRSDVELWHLCAARSFRWTSGVITRLVAQLMLVGTLASWLRPTRASQVDGVPVDVDFVDNSDLTPKILLFSTFLLLDFVGRWLQRRSHRTAQERDPRPPIAWIAKGRDKSLVWSTMRDGAVAGMLSPMPLARFQTFVQSQLAGSGRILLVGTHDEERVQRDRARAVVLPLFGQGESEGDLREALTVAAEHERVLLVVSPQRKRASRSWTEFQRAAIYVPFYADLLDADVPRGTQVLARRPDGGWRVWGADQRTDWTYACCLGRAMAWLDDSESLDPRAADSRNSQSAAVKNRSR